MKIISAPAWWVRLFAGERRTEKLRLLQQQRLLLRQGLETWAEVIDTLLSEDRIGNLLCATLWIKLKKTDGSYIYTHTNTLLSVGKMPGKGEKVRIKYLPENLSSVLIL